MIGKGIATIAVCALGAWVEYYTNVEHGISWAIIGVFFIWAA